MPHTEEQIQELVREMYTIAETSEWDLAPEEIRVQSGRHWLPLPDAKILVLVAAAVILVVVGFVVANGSTSHRTAVSGPSTTNSTLSTGHPIAVPSLVGETQTQAATALSRVGLEAGPIDLVANRSVKAGVVISENPQPGSLVSAGSLVTLTVSSGPSPVHVPSLVGLSQNQAANVLRDAGLSVGSTSPQSSTTIPAGAVAGSRPSAGTLVVPGSSVDLVVSTGQSPAAP